MDHKVNRVLSLLLALVMVVGFLPFGALAAEEEGNTETATASIDAQAEKNPHSLTIASTKKENLAPGVTETTVVSYDANGNRVQYFVVNANIATDSTVQVKANYHDNDNTGVWGKATVVEQANSAKEKRGYNVVATTNAAYYNVSTGQPTGAFVMEGVNINGNGMGDQYEFFAIMKDGSAMIGKKSTFSQYADQIQEAVAGHLLLVWDGKVVEGLNTVNKYPRSTVGLTAEGNVVLMLADGNNSPYSIGLTYAEQAQLMLELGCVSAIELDGGGSATYAAKLEGSDEVVLRSVPCDGTIRSVSNSLMVISTAVPDGQFDHANLSTEYAFYAPNSKVEINAVPVDAAGGASEMPADASWSLSDDSFGTVADGVFTSTGKLGTVTVNVSSNGEVVGSIDVTLVDPTEIAFSADEKTVPYGKTSDFTITAMFNGAEMYVPADAFTFEVTAGSMDGFIYSAPADGVANATVTATYKYAQLNPIQVFIIFGKGSDILFDFEDGDLSDWADYQGLLDAEANGTYTGGSPDFKNNDPNKADTGNSIEPGMKDNIFLAKKSEGGKTYSGEYSLGFTIDYTQHQSHGNWLYDYLFYLGDTITYRDVENGINGTRLGMWMYIPEEAVGLCARLAYTYQTASGGYSVAYLYFTYQYVAKGFSKLTSEKIPEAGWAYVYCDLDDISTTYVTSAYYAHPDGTPVRDPASNYAPAFIQFIVSSSALGAEKCTVYIDDITLDYSDVVDDRDAPIIKNPMALDDLNNYSMGTTLTFNTVSFTADVAEDTSHGTNFTGLDAATAQVYVDGQKVATTYSAGKLATANLVLANGVHDVTFEIADKQGNYTKLTKQITIAAEDSEYPSVTVTGEPMGVNKDGNLYSGGQYNLLLNTDKVEAIDKITTKIWLNSASKWSLENISVLPGFKAEYVLDELACTATITVERVGEVAATGAATLVTIPVYAWAWDGTTHDAHDQWTGTNGGGGCAPQVTLSYDVKYGEVVYTADYAVNTANYVCGFGSARKDVKTELNTSIANLKKTIGEWHYHTVTAVADVAATCTTDGHTGRTECSVCKSILNWGTTKATGHNYTLTDNVLKCVCGELFTGVWTDGKEYVNGVQVADGWNGDYYYRNGVKLTGIQEVEGLYYNFGEDGKSQGTVSGLFELDGVSHYAVLGELKSGWVMEDNNWYYFDTDTFAGADGVRSAESTGLKELLFNYVFEDGKLTTGVWVETAKGTRYYYGPDCYINGLKEIDGKQYYFDSNKALARGIQMLKLDSWSAPTVYVFDDNDGSLQGVLDYSGIYLYKDEYYYLEAGVVKTGAGMIQWEGDYYFIRGTGKVQTGSYYCNKNNGLLPNGTYEFGDDGKMLQGLVGTSYYKNGQLYAAGMIEIDGEFYFVRGSGEVVTGSYYCDKNNGLLPNGTYEFDVTGKMLQGLNGTAYYKNGQLYSAGMITVDGAYYYIAGDGHYVTGKYYCTKMNDLLPAGTYYFGEDGKILQGIVETSDGLYYYVDGRLYAAGMIEIDGEFYFVRGSGKVVTGSYYCNNNHDILPTGTYLFHEDGRMYNGIELVDGVMYYYEMGKLKAAGLIEIDGEFYFVRGSGKVVTGKYYCNNNHGILADGNYLFHEDGRMYNGIELVDGVMYYYEMGKLKAAGLIEIDGEFYFVRGSGKVVTGTYYCNNNHGILADGNYLFHEDGRMYNGIEEVDGVLYYYEMGKLKAAGMIEVDGELYYVRGSGALVVNASYYCTKNNGLIRNGTYEFDAEGKMVR